MGTPNVSPKMGPESEKYFFRLLKILVAVFSAPFGFLVGGLSAVRLFGPTGGNFGAIRDFVICLGVGGIVGTLIGSIFGFIVSRKIGRVLEDVVPPARSSKREDPQEPRRGE